MHVMVEWEHDCDELMAKEVARTLMEAYPLHPWHVSIMGGCIVVKMMNVSPKWGMVRKYDAVKHGAAVLKREIVSAGGEFLERAGLSRGVMTEQPIQAVEGIPSKDLRLH